MTKSHFGLIYVCHDSWCFWTEDLSHVSSAKSNCVAGCFQDEAGEFFGSLFLVYDYVGEYGYVKNRWVRDWRFMNLDMLRLLFPDLLEVMGVLPIDIY